MVRNANSGIGTAMADIGTIMFGKAIVLAAGAWGAERYKAYKAKRREAGVSLRYDAKRDTHYDPILRFERRVKICIWVIGVPLALYTALAVALFIGPPLAAKLLG